MWRMPGRYSSRCVATRQGDCFKREGILPEEEQSGFRPSRVTVDMMFVARCLHGLARKKLTSLHACFIVLTKAYDSVNRDLLLWSVLKRLRVPPKICGHSPVSRQHKSARTGGQQNVLRLVRRRIGIRQGCSVAPLLYNLFSAGIHDPPSSDRRGFDDRRGQGQGDGERGEEEVRLTGVISGGHLRYAPRQRREYCLSITGEPRENDGRSSCAWPGRLDCWYQNPRDGDPVNAR